MHVRASHPARERTSSAARRAIGAAALAQCRNSARYRRQPPSGPHAYRSSAGRAGVPRRSSERPGLASTQTGSRPGDRARGEIAPSSPTSSPAGQRADADAVAARAAVDRAHEAAQAVTGALHRDGLAGCTATIR